jgi:hypothetical protein
MVSPNIPEGFPTQLTNMAAGSISYFGFPATNVCQLSSLTLDQWCTQELCRRLTCKAFDLLYLQNNNDEVN